MSAFQQDFSASLKGSALGGFQLLSEALAHLLQCILAMRTTWNLSTTMWACGSTALTAAQ